MLIWPKFWRKRKNKISWLMKLNHDSSAVWEVFGITEKRLDDIFSYVKDVHKNSDRMSSIIQNLANTEFFANDKERVLAIFIAGKMSSPISSIIGMIGRLGGDEK